jgi:hypothetical protein
LAEFRRGKPSGPMAVQRARFKLMVQGSWGVRVMPNFTETGEFDGAWHLTKGSRRNSAMCLTRTDWLADDASEQDQGLMSVCETPGQVRCGLFRRHNFVKDVLVIESATRSAHVQYWREDGNGVELRRAAGAEEA